MRLGLIQIFCTLLISILNIQVFAAEGFKGYSEQMPDAVKNAWPASFMTLIEEPKTYIHGTAFLIHVTNSGMNSQLYFLTSKHLLHGHCNRIGFCPELQLFGEAQLEVIASAERLVYGRNRLANVEVLKLSSKPDLALLRVVVKSQGMPLPKALFISPKCSLSIGDQLYAVGFPNMTLRRAPQTQILELKNTIIKRWSSGIFVGTVDTREGKNLLLGTTVDSLVGNSGGPYLNEQGEVVGLAQLSASVSENNYQYTGIEILGQLDWQSEAITCLDLHEFLDSEINRARP